MVSQSTGQEGAWEESTGRARPGGGHSPRGWEHICFTGQHCQAQMAEEILILFLGPLQNFHSPDSPCNGLELRATQLSARLLYPWPCREGTL